MNRSDLALMDASRVCESECFDYAERAEGRSAGVLLPLFSLPSRGGIGCMDQEAYRFLDFLKKAGFHSWQLLPLSVLGRDASPYSSISGFAGDPAYISLEELKAKGWLLEEEILAAGAPAAGCAVDYRWQRESKDPLLRLAFRRFMAASDPEELRAWEAFRHREADWLPDHSLFLALLRRYQTAPLQTWPLPLRRREPEALEAARAQEREECRYQDFLQYLFFLQWERLRAYARNLGIELIGDLPIYPSVNSLEVWLYPQSFAVGDDLQLLASGGCPPDADGSQQAWGNPVYHWTWEAEHGFPCWTRRVRQALSLYDCFRIDHFRGLEAYWAIPSSGQESSFKEGWYHAPGHDLFRHLYQSFPGLRLIAEDLGYKSRGVAELRQAFAIPGMRVLRYGFAPWQDSEHLPHHLLPDSVYYFSTHDDLPLKAWLDQASEEEKAFARRYFHNDDLLRVIPDGMLASPAGRVIFQMQDLLLLGQESRCNLPGSDASWRWRLRDDESSPERYSQLAEDWNERLRCYGRCAEA